MCHLVIVSNTDRRVRIIADSESMYGVHVCTTRNGNLYLYFISSIKSYTHGSNALMYDYSFLLNNQL